MQSETDDDDVWQMPMKREYHYTLRNFMGWLNNTAYGSPDKTFTKEELLQIKPPDILDWMNFRVYGKIDPSESDSPLRRSSSVDYWNKALSFFMPNQYAWVEEGGQPGHGDPTRSKDVKNVMNKLLKKEMELGISPNSNNNYKSTRGPFVCDRIQDDLSDNTSDQQEQQHPHQQQQPPSHTFQQAFLLELQQIKQAITTLRTTIERNRQLDRQYFDDRINELNNNIRRFGVGGFGGNIQEEGRLRRKKPAKRKSAAAAAAAAAVEGTVTAAATKIHGDTVRDSLIKREAAAAEATVTAAAATVTAATAAAPKVELPVLAPNLRTLKEYWEEWEFGIGNRKAAKDWSSKERGKHKMQFYQRRCIWNLMLRLVNKGYDIDSTIALIKQTYGEKKSCTAIARLIVKDKKKYAKDGGLHPNFR